MSILLPRTWIRRFFPVLTNIKSNTCLVTHVECHHTQSADLTSTPSEVEGKTDQWMQEASLYVHFPYCEKRCTYCNFNKYISDNINHERMTKCLEQETETLLNLSGVTTIRSVFFGGGTPSLAEASTIHRVLEAVRRTSSLKTDAEITIEANPTSTETAKLQAFKDAGINRVSIGVQALRDKDLSLLGRQHTVEEALRCVESCRSLFPDKTSVDVMFGRPGQTVEAWREEMDEVLSVCDSHVSLYQLTLERGTRLFKQVMDRELYLPSPDMVAEMYETAVEKFAEKGFNRYEVSNFARTTSAQSIHNQGYWEGLQFIGVGPGAHGRFVPRGQAERESRIQTLEPEPWMREVERHGQATRRRVKQSSKDILQEMLMLGLRTTEGIPAERWSRFSLDSLADVFMSAYMTRVLKDEGFIDVTDRVLRATARGLNVADAVTCELITILDKHMELSAS